MYMLSLVYYGDKPHGEENRRLVVLPKTPRTADFIEDSIAALKSGTWGSTGQVSTHEFRLYSLPPHSASRWNPFRKPEPSRVEGTITCWDVPGQLLERGLDDERVRRLAAADGMILLIGAEQHQAQMHLTYYHRFFFNTMVPLIRYFEGLPEVERQRLGWRIDGDRKIPFPVAFCLSQVDRLDPPEQEQAFGMPEELILQRMGESPKILTELFRNHAYFGVSSTGMRLRKDGERELLPADPEPENVLQPLQWIVQEWRKA